MFNHPNTVFRKTKKVEAKHFKYKLSLFAYTPKMDFIYVMAFRSTVLSAGERTSIKKQMRIEHC